MGYTKETPLATFNGTNQGTTEENTRCKQWKEASSSRKSNTGRKFLEEAEAADALTILETTYS
jgi:hypothetical protein